MREFVIDTLTSGVLSAALLAIAAFLGKSQIAHWFSKVLEEQKARIQRELEEAKAGYQRDLESVRAAFQRDIEKVKADHQRELEAYKVSLIAEAERAKAAQDIKKATALKVVEMKCTALDRYQRAFTLTRYRTASVAIIPQQYRDQKACNEMLDALQELTDAENALDLFLDDEEQSILFAFRKALTDHYVPFLNPSAGTMTEQQKQDAEKSRGLPSIGVERLIQKKVAEMLQAT